MEFSDRAFLPNLMITCLIRVSSFFYNYSAIALLKKVIVSALKRNNKHLQDIFCIIQTVTYTVLG